MEGVMAWGAEIILALQQVPWLIGIMRLYTGLGTEEFFLLLMPALYWSISAGLGRRLAVVLVASVAVNDVLKLAFKLPRPYWVEPRVAALSTEPTYGLPSGHAQTATVVWGYLAAQAAARLKVVAWMLALVVVLLVSVSRIYLGVHFPTDVAGGWVFGGAILWAYLRWHPQAASWLARLDLGRQVAIAGLASVLYLVLTWGVLAAWSDLPDPESWALTAAAAAEPALDGPAIHPRSPVPSVNAAGMIFGLGTALAFATRWARFDAGGVWQKRLARYLIGVVGILVFWRGLALFFPVGEDPVALVYRFFRYALTVYWAIFLAPWAYLKVGLAAREPAALMAQARQQPAAE
jgi:membrane-associated phospholipid phosphatase